VSDDISGQVTRRYEAATNDLNAALLAYAADPSEPNRAAAEASAWAASAAAFRLADLDGPGVAAAPRRDLTASGLRELAVRADRTAAAASRMGADSGPQIAGLLAQLAAMQGASASLARQLAELLDPPAETAP
jgi:hypothetical protein